MRKFLAIALYCLIASIQLKSQILPKENSVLNYRLVGFSVPPVQNASKYRVEIAKGNYNSTDSFKKNIVYSGNSKTNKIIAEIPSFGAQYTWRILIESNNISSSGNGELHHFSTSSIPETDTNVMRLRIIHKAEKYKDAYVFLDGNRSLYDVNGKQVWYLPDVDGFKTERSDLRDMKLSGRGTITFLYEERGAYEVDLNGKIIWKAPNDGKVSGQGNEFYHHEFTRLANGHYMILGCEYELWNQHLPSADSSFVIFHDDKKRDSSRRKYISIPFGTVIEYDEKGNVVWSWRSAQYFKNSDIYYHTSPHGGRPDIAPHENSLYFDEKDNVLYIGFRNISRILKVKYPEGNVLNAYGEEYKPGVDEKGNGLYCRQHSVRRSEKGYLYLYNNNSCRSGDGLPKIMKMGEPAPGDNELKKIWEYECTVEGELPDQHVAHQFPVGGNVVELPDQSIFANMSTTYSKVFILDRDKKIRWSAIPEKWNAQEQRWDMVYQYRANIITNRKDLEDMIWSAETN